MPFYKNPKYKYYTSILHLPVHTPVKLNSTLALNILAVLQRTILSGLRVTTEDCMSQLGWNIWNWCKTRCESEDVEYKYSIDWGRKSLIMKTSLKTKCWIFSVVASLGRSYFCAIHHRFALSFLFYMFYIFYTILFSNLKF